MRSAHTLTGQKLDVSDARRNRLVGLCAHADLRLSTSLAHAVRSHCPANARSTTNQHQGQGTQADETGCEAGSVACS
jgi:hypothetical protein